MMWRSISKNVGCDSIFRAEGYNKSMGYQSDKQVYRYYLDIARKTRQRDCQSCERAKKRNIRIARAIGISLAFLILSYFALQYR